MPIFNFHYIFHINNHVLKKVAYVMKQCYLAIWFIPTFLQYNFIVNEKDLC